MQKSLKYLHKVTVYNSVERKIVRDDIEIIGDRKYFTTELLDLLKENLPLGELHYLKVKIILQLTIKE